MPTPTARSFPGISLVVGLLVLSVPLVPARPALAAEADPAVLDKITKLNRKALDEYQNLNFDEARKLLQEALDAASEAGLDRHPAAARTYVHLGVVVLAGLKQKDEAVKLFRKALDIQPDIKLDKSLATPEIQEVYDSVAASASKTEESTKPADGEGITHEAVTRSPQGKPIVIKAEVASSVGAKKVVLSYSADGADEFAENEMTEDPPGSGVYTTEVPASATQGGVVDYFIEARGDDDKILASKGSAQKAMKILLLGANGEPVVTLMKRKKREAPPPKEDEGPTWFLGLGLGSGLGWTTGYGEINSHDKIQPAGFAPSTLGHLAPEIGYFISPAMLLSFQLRLQYVTGATPYYGAINGECGSDNICSPAWNAVAGFAKASFLLAEGDFRPYVSGIAGGGQIRHVAKFDSVKSCGPNQDQTCIDTVAAGPIFVGAGGGFLYAVAPGFDLTLGANALVGFTTFTFHVDVNAGVAMTF
jgi:hypothetical protein